MNSCDEQYTSTNNDTGKSLKVAHHEHEGEGAQQDATDFPHALCLGIVSRTDQINRVGEVCRREHFPGVLHPGVMTEDDQGGVCPEGPGEYFPADEQALLFDLVGKQLLPMEQKARDEQCIEEGGIAPHNFFHFETPFKGTNSKLKQNSSLGNDSIKIVFCQCLIFMNTCS